MNVLQAGIFHEISRLGIRKDRALFSMRLCLGLSLSSDYKMSEPPYLTGLRAHFVLDFRLEVDILWVVVREVAWKVDCLAGAVLD